MTIPSMNVSSFNPWPVRVEVGDSYTLIRFGEFPAELAIHCAGLMEIEAMGQAIVDQARQELAHKAPSKKPKKESA